jgi:hypothetical protein
MGLPWVTRGHKYGKGKGNLKQKPTHPSLTETIFMLILNHGYESLSKLQGIMPSAVRDNSAWQYDCAILVILEPH